MGILALSHYSNFQISFTSLCTSPQVSCSQGLIYALLGKWPHIVPKQSIARELKCPFPFSQCLLAWMTMPPVVYRQPGCHPYRPVVCSCRIRRKYQKKARKLYFLLWGPEANHCFLHGFTEMWSFTFCEALLPYCFAGGTSLGAAMALSEENWMGRNSL